MTHSFVTPWTISCQAPRSMGFSRQEYWSGLPFFSPGGLPEGLNPSLLHHGFYCRPAILPVWRVTKWSSGLLVLLPGRSHGRRSLVGYSPWGRGESDTTERLHVHFSLSCIGEGTGNPLQCSCLENPRDRGACWAAVYGVAQSRTRLKLLSSSSSSASLLAQTVKNLPAMQETWIQFLGWEDPLGKGMATLSGSLAWRIPLTEEPGRLQPGAAPSQTRLSN